MKLEILTGDADADALWLGRGSSCGSRLGLLEKRPANGPSSPTELLLQKITITNNRIDQMFF